MSTQEHLNKIVAKCRELLAIGEKRTTGKWKRERQRIFRVGGEFAITGLTSTNDDADYIASCAGAAEAGWKATIAAIDSICRIDDFESREAKEIIAAWPEDLL